MSFRRPLSLLVTLLAVLGCSSAVAQTNGAPSASPPIIDLRLASANPMSGFSAMQGIGGIDELSVVYLAPAAVVSDEDVMKARTRPATDGLVLEILLSNEAAARLRQTTATNIRLYLAVLANGRLAGTAIIMESIPKGNRVTVGLTLSPAVAEAVRARVAARWPEQAP
jgi:hypothetical protein